MKKNSKNSIMMAVIIGSLVPAMSLCAALSTKEDHDGSLVGPGVDLSAQAIGGDTVPTTTADTVKLLIDAGAKLEEDRAKKDTHIFSTRALRMLSGSLIKPAIMAIEHEKKEANSKQQALDPQLDKAIKKNDYQEVKRLIEHNVPVDGCDDDGNTALMRAAIDLDSEMVKLLIDAKAALDTQNKYGETALIIAARRTDTLIERATNIIKLLVDAGAALNTQEKDYHDTALILVAQWGDAHAVSLLVDAGAELEIENKEGCTALINAICSKVERVEKVQLLLNAKAVLDMQALITAAHWRHNNIAQLLIDAGVALDVRDEKGNTALIIASDSNNVELVQLLIESKAALNLQNKEGSTALMEALVQHSADINMVKLLIDGENTQNKYGDTAIIIAMREAVWLSHKRPSDTSIMFDIIKMLIIAGADMNIKNKQSQLFFDLTASIPQLKAIIDEAIAERERIRAARHHEVESYVLSLPGLAGLVMDYEFGFREVDRMDYEFGREEADSVEAEAQEYKKRKLR